MFRKLGVSPDAVVQDTRAIIERLPKVTGTSEVYLADATKSVLEAAFEEAARMKDEYVSIEHIQRQGPSADPAEKHDAKILT